MSNIKFVSHEEFPDDLYTTELVYLLIDDKYRIAYVRKKSKTGGKFWGAPSVAITSNGCKVYFECFLQDSSFLEKDIKKFLDDRLWEKGKQSMKSTIDEEEIPF